MPGSKISEAPGISFAAAFVHLELGRELRKTAWSGETARRGLGHKMCSLRVASLGGAWKGGSLWRSAGVLSWVRKNNRQGLLKAKQTFLWRTHRPGA